MMLENPVVLNDFDVIVPLFAALEAPVMCAAPDVADTPPVDVNCPRPPVKLSEKITVVTD
ncbi:MAG: hypothetical protein E6J91_12070 [Deltaproteobacteria bacterium]|nr:MAG: hypothetical protein E6J91_12070 [Deltaproteobacteria bacterium]